MLFSALSSKKRAFIVLLVAFASICNIAHASTGEILAAEGNRDPHYNILLGQANLYTGSSAYTYPLEAPPGINGLTPQLSISYSSQGYRGPAGWTGLGWALSGLGQIERSTKMGAPQYNKNDTLLLDGQELVEIETDLYRTKINDYRRIENKSGYWLVTTKDGTQYRYGYNNNSKIEAVGLNDSVRLWALDKITDTSGNSIEINYSEDTVNGDFYISHITYNSIQAIQFITEDRPDKSIDYSYSTPIKEDRRLKWIEVRSNGSLVRKYGLNYTKGQSSNRSLLTSITLYGSDGTSTLPPTTFAYQENNQSWDPEGGYYRTYRHWNCDGYTYDEGSEGDPNVNSDGIWDIPNNFYLQTRQEWDNDNGSYYSSGEGGRLVDINGDGFDDLVDSGGKVYINNQSGWTRNSSWDFPFTFSAGMDLVDADGDGLTDILINNGTVHLNNGSGWEKSNWTTPFNVAGTPQVRFGDINGDGLLDIVSAYHYHEHFPGQGTGSSWIQHDYYFYVWLNNGTGWVEINGGAWGTYQKWDSEGELINDSTWGNSSINSDGIWDVPTHFLYEFYNPIGAHKYYHQGRLADVNGDGLSDFLGNGSENVYINDGNGWDSDTNTTGVQPYPDWMIPVDFYNGDEDNGIRLVDINGDGLPDIVPNVGGVYFNNGTGWVLGNWIVPIKSVDGEGNSQGVAFGDLNGDGMTDILQSYHYYYYARYSCGGGTDDHNYTYKIWFNEDGKVPDLLAQQVTPAGGTTNFTYNSSTKYDNTGNDSIPDLHFSIPLLESIVTDNGMTGAHQTVSTTNYSYAAGLYNPDDKEFRGFNYARETDSRGTTTEHYYHQDNARKGREYETVVNDTSGSPYQKTENTWNFTNSSGVIVVRLNQSDSYTYDGNTSNPKITRTIIEYDEYGNPVKTSQLGDTSVSGDEKYAYTEYVYNTSAWILNRPNHTYLHASDDATKASESWYYYDNQNITDPPTKGELTKEEHWLDTGSNPVSLYEYDAYGNVINTTDALGRSTLTVYDATNTFPATITNPLDQQTNFTYDTGTGNLLSSTDPNGFTTSYEYDIFGRITKEIRPYDSSAYPTLNYTYYQDGTAPELTLVSQREENGTTDTLDTFTITDGFERTVQTRRDAENPSYQIIQNTFYNEIGKVGKQSVPYYGLYNTTYSTPVNVRNISYDYDPMGRVNYMENTDGTNKTIGHNRWTTTETDENGHQKKKHADAHGRITKVQEYNDGETYNTTYSYDALDNLVNITDNSGNVFRFYFDSLGRKTSIDDPDLGIWNYTYDALGNLLTQTGARGTTISFEYDTLNRITKESRPSDGNTTYTYDMETIGTLSELNTSDSSTHYYYDERFRKTKEDIEMDGLTWTTLWTYDAADRLATQTETDGTILNFTYNEQGQVETLAGRMQNVDYNAMEKITLKDYNNTLTTSYTYNTDDFRLASIQTPGLQDFSYAYDGVGNVITIADSINASTQTFTYDDLDRLTSAQESDNGYSRNYTYNPIGNLLKIEGDTKTWTFTYGNGTKIPHAITNKDTTPVLSLVSPVFGVYTNNSWMLFNYTATDDDDDTLTYTVYADTSQSPASQIYNGPNTYYNWTSRPDDVYYWKVNVTDGYTNQTTNTRKFTIDLVPPEITITNVDNTSQTIEWQATDNHGLSHFDITYNDTYFYKGLVPYDIFEELADGTYNVTVTAYDHAGSPSTDTTILTKNTSGSNANGELLVFSKYIDYNIAPGETISAEVFVFNRGTTELADGVRIDVRDETGVSIHNKWERIIVPAGGMRTISFEYELPSGANSGLYSVRALFTEDQKEKPSYIRWFSVGGGG
jgi:YD repeat-containing protein